MCEACAAGQPPAPRPRALTALEKFLGGRLGLARLEGFWARSDGPPMVDLRWFLRPEELHTGRLVRARRSQLARPYLNPRRERTAPRGAAHWVSCRIDQTPISTLGTSVLLMGGPQHSRPAQSS